MVYWSCSERYIVRLRPACVVSSALLALLAIVGCGGSSSGSTGGGTANPPFTYIVTTSAPSVTFPSTTVGSIATMAVTLTNGGTAPIVFNSIALNNTTATAFSQTSTCGTTLMVASSCTATITFAPTVAGPAAANLTFTDNATAGPQTVSITGTGAAAVSTISVPPSPFVNVTVGLPSPTLIITYTNLGTGAIVFSGVALAGANPSLFSLSTTCTGTLAPNAACTASVIFTPVTSGSFSASVVFSDNFPSGSQTVALTGSAIAIASAANTQDCSVATGFCPELNLLGDPLAPGGFHGYADPSMRKDPNSPIIYFAYSWARTLSDGTHVVDLHLASSANNGASFTELGPLYQSTQSTQTTSTAYNSVNDSSTETIDLLPVPLTGTNTGQTLWVQAHQSYLVKPQAGIYDQLNATSLISVSAVQLTAAQQASSSAAGAALLGLASAPEARLAAVSTDPNRNPTQSLAALSPATSKCGNFGQPALWYQAGTLYLALECSEITGTGQVDANELAHFLYSTTPSGPDASQWTWAYAGEFATGAQAAKLGALASENVAYQFFTEPEFALSKSGQLLLILTPSVFAPQTAQQPVIQYGCRTIPVTSLSPTGITLDTDAATGAPVVTSRITETDLYTAPNEGPAACTYEPAATSGVVIGRKYENDPTYGFYIYPVATGIFP